MARGTCWSRGGTSAATVISTTAGAKPAISSAITIGAEALGRDWDVRANSYWPVGTTVRHVDSLTTVSLSGATITLRGGEEHALRGFDAEVGWRVPAFAADGPLDLRVYAGGYTFDDADVPDVTGPRLRAEFTAYEVPRLWDGARLTLGAEWQDDDVRGSQAFASLRLRIPLQSEKSRSRRLSAQERRMTAPIVRDVDIVAQAGTFGPTETVTQTAGGETLTVLDDATTTSAALPGAIAAAGANSTVVLSGSFSPTAATTLQSGQTVMCGGSLQVKSPSGRTATLSLPTATVSPTIAGAGGYTTNPTFILANDTTLTGLNISLTRSGANAVALYGSGVSNVTIANSTITTTTSGANHSALGVVLVNNSLNNTVSNNTITATAGSNTGTTAYGLGLVSNGRAVVSGNTFTASGAQNNYSMHFNTGHALSGSTGNVRTSTLNCNGNPTSGAVYFTDGHVCN